MLIRSHHPSCRSRYSDSSPCPGSVPVLASATLRDFFVTILALLACGAVCAQSRLTPPAQNNAEPATPGEGAHRSPGKHLAAAEKSRKAYLTFQIRRAGLSADDLITYRGFYISKDGLAVAPLQAFDSGDFMARNETDGSEVKVVGLISVEADYGFAIMRTDQKERPFLRFSPTRTPVGARIAIPRPKQNGGSVTAPVLARRKAPLSRAQKYLEVLSLGVNFGENGILHVPAGTPVLNQKGEVAGCLYQPTINSRQRFLLAAPVSAIALKSPVDPRTAPIIPFPLPPGFQPADPLALDAAYLLGRDAQLAGEVVQAEQLLRKALARHPQSAVGWQRLGLVLRDRNRGEEAMKAFQNAADYGNNLGSFLLNQADQLSLMGKLEEATALLAESCKTTPFDYDLHRAYAVALRALKDETSAEKHLRIATVLAPDSLRCWNLLSKCLARQGKWPSEKKASDKIYELESLYRPR